MNYLAVMVVLGLAGYWVWRIYRHAAIGFHYEMWRAPFITLRVIANDPNWLVCDGPPEQLMPRAGMFGPVTLLVQGVRIGAYIRDEDRYEEVTERTKHAIRKARKRDASRLEPSRAD